jgi:hypothetical protein
MTEVFFKAAGIVILCGVGTFLYLKVFSLINDLPMFNK